MLLEIFFCPLTISTFYFFLRGWLLGTWTRNKLEVKFLKCCYVSQCIFLLPQAIFKFNLFVISIIYEEVIYEEVKLKNCPRKQRNLLRNVVTI